MLIGSVAYNTTTTKDENHDTPQASGLMSLQQQQPKRNTTTKSAPSRSGCRILRHKWGHHSLCFAAAVLMMIILCFVVQDATALGPKWLQHRLKRIAAAHLTIEATTVAPETAPPPLETIDTSKSTYPESESSSAPLLVVATHEGQVWTIDATDGRIIAGFSTGPPLLVMDDHFEEGEDASLGLSPQQSQIVPSMDGMIYWRTNSPDGPKLTPVRPIRDLVDNPIQICPRGEGQSCDILTATSLGPSLFSLNSQGSLNWARARHSGETTRAKPVPMQRTSSSSSSSTSSASASADLDDDETDSTANSSSSRGSFLLQRQDYLVQQISTETGEQISNITWGNLERIDFMGDDNDSSSRRRRRDDQSFHFLPSDEPSAASSDLLPSVIFGNQGKSIVAVLTQPPKFLWKSDFISVVTGVFGIADDSWQAVNVVAEHDGPEVDDVMMGGGPGAHHHRHMYPELPSHSSEPSAEEEAERWYWFWAGGASGLGKKNKAMEQYLIHGQEDAGLIFVPRPPAHTFVRNSWYLNHLWNSPQAMGAQRFQGYLSDHSHKEEEERQSQRKSPTAPQLPNKQQQWHPYPTTFYDTSNMPRLMLLPPGDHPSSDTTKTGGVFLSWPVVMAIVFLLVGTVAVAYLVYGHKKRKWLATSNAQQTNISVTSQDVTSETMSISIINDERGPSISGGREKSTSQSKERSQARLQDDFLRNSDSNIGTQLANLSVGNPVKHVLNRSSSAPIMTGEHLPSFSRQPINQGLAINSLHMRQDSSNIRPSSPSEQQVEKPIVITSQMVKHQSAPVEAPLLPQGGVGMIDGIPLIRYSRYQSEFRELEPLGRGGFGTVFRVANVLDGREYAVKKVSIRSSDFSSPGTEAFSQELHRVLREVKFLALLDHPNIVRYYTAWLEMEEKEDNTIPNDENTNTLSRRFSSELLTSLDPTNGLNGDNNTTTPSFLGRKHSTSTSRATLSHLKGRNATNPLGWNSFGKFEESSTSSFYPRHTMPVFPPTDEDCGFIFEERSDEEEEEEEDPSFGGHRRPSYGRSVASSEGSKSEFSHSISSSWDASFSTNKRQKNALGDSKNNKPEEEKKGSPEPRARRNSNSSRHTLYIQMQLCSSKTLGDFLGDKEARQGPASSASSESVDIPRALRLFLQIVQAVQHVHKQNLIHRDLKPSNCFIDDRGTVKVGDFGLSRESNDGNDNSASASLLVQDEFAGDNTVGVGTRSYASPEQMNGSDYDSKTDIYALGVMLFELLYPMYTGMERHICFQKLRTTCTFPDSWHTTVSGPFPTLNDLVQSMLSLNPKDRPTADKVARQIQSLLEEHSVSLNFSLHDGEHDNVMFVRVEAKPVPDILKVIIELIHEAASPRTVDVVQYGMRSSTKSSKVSGQKGEKRAILEFALACIDVEPKEVSTWASTLAGRLEESNEVLVARHVWHQEAEQTF